MVGALMCAAALVSSSCSITVNGDLPEVTTTPGQPTVVPTVPSSENPATPVPVTTEVASSTAAPETSISESAPQVSVEPITTAAQPTVPVPVPAMTTTATKTVTAVSTAATTVVEPGTATTVPTTVATTVPTTVETTVEKTVATTVPTTVATTVATTVPTTVQHTVEKTVATTVQQTRTVTATKTVTPVATTSVAEPTTAPSTTKATSTSKAPAVVTTTTKPTEPTTTSTQPTAKPTTTATVPQGDDCLFPAVGRTNNDGTKYNPFRCEGSDIHVATDQEKALSQAEREKVAAAKVVARMNVARAREGISPLTQNDKLTAVAEHIARRYRDNESNLVAGVNITGLDLSMRVFMMGPGANVETATAAVLVAASMADATTRAAVMNPADTVTGVSLVLNPQNGFVYVVIASAKDAAKVSAPTGTTVVPSVTIAPTVPSTTIVPAPATTSAAVTTPTSSAAPVTTVEPSTTVAPVTTAPVTTKPAVPAAQGVAAANAAFVDELNAARTREGQRALPTDSQLNELARQFAAHLATGSPAPAGQPYVRMYVTGQTTFNNPADPQSIAASDVVDRVLADNDVRTALLSPRSSQLGTAVIVVGNSVYYGVAIRTGGAELPSAATNPETCGTAANGASLYNTSTCGPLVRVLSGTDATTPDSEQEATFNAQLLEYINQARTVRGLSPLTLDSSLASQASLWFPAYAAKEFFPAAPAGWNSSNKQGSQKVTISALSNGRTNIASMNPAGFMSMLPRGGSFWSRIMDPNATSVGLATSYNKSNGDLRVVMATN